VSWKGKIALLGALAVGAVLYFYRYNYPLSLLNEALLPVSAQILPYLHNPMLLKDNWAGNQKWFLRNLPLIGGSATGTFGVASLIYKSVKGRSDKKLTNQFNGLLTEKNGEIEGQSTKIASLETELEKATQHDEDKQDLINKQQDLIMDMNTKLQRQEDQIKQLTDDFKYTKKRLDEQLKVPTEVIHKAP